jgi:site-specific DNA recombinase
MKITKTLTAAIYARFSTEHQSLESLVDQRRMCERTATQNGIKVVAQFEDAGISGGTSDRPGYQAMLSAARRGEFSVIIAEDLKRLWREQAEQHTRMKEFMNLRILIMTASGFDSRQPGADLIASVQGAAAELERKETAYRTRRGLEGRARAGKSTGGRCYGYVPASESESGDVAVDETQASVVVRIFNAFLSGESPRDIASALNADGVPSPGSFWKGRSIRRGSGWVSSAIHGDVKKGTGMLRNRRYIGEVTFGRAEWKQDAANSKVRRMELRDAPLHVRTDERLRIVSQDLWDRVQAALIERANRMQARVGKWRGGRPPGSGSRYLLSGLLRCGECGSSVTACDARNYGCGGFLNGGPHICGTHFHRIRRELLDTKILESLDCEDLHRRTRQELVAALMAPSEELIEESGADTSIDAEFGPLAQLIVAGQATRAQIARMAEITHRMQTPSAPRLTSRKMMKRPEAERIARNLSDRLPRTAERIRALCASDVQQARTELGRVTGRITLREAEGGKSLYAEWDLGPTQLMGGLNSLTALASENLVAGAGFEPATFGL